MEGLKSPFNMKGNGGEKMQVLFDLPTETKYAYRFNKDSKFIPLVYDDMFLTMLNNEGRKQYVAILIAYCTGLKYEYIIKNIQFIKNTLDKRNYYDSRKTVDLVVKVGEKIYNIEMNNWANIQALERNIDYAHEIYRSQRFKGEEYKYQQTIQINICNFRFRGNKQTIEEYHIQNKNYILTEKVKFIFIYLPNIREKFYNKEELTDIEKLMLAYNETRYEDIKEVVGGNKIMKEYRKEAEEASEIQELWERLAYDKEAEQKWLYETELQRRDYVSAKRTKEEAAIAFHDRGVSDDIICDALSITEEELHDILRKAKDNESE